MKTAFIYLLILVAVLTARVAVAADPPKPGTYTMVLVGEVPEGKKMSSNEITIITAVVTQQGEGRLAVALNGDPNMGERAALIKSGSSAEWQLIIYERLGDRVSALGEIILQADEIVGTVTFLRGDGTAYKRSHIKMVERK